MKFRLFFLITSIGFLAKSQSAEAQDIFDGMIFSFHDSAHYYFKYDKGSYEFFDTHNKAIFSQKFSEFPINNDQVIHFKNQENKYPSSSFFKGIEGEKVFVFNPITKFILEINPKLKSLYKYQDIAVVFSSLSHDTLIRLNQDIYLNKKGEIIFNSEWYSEMTNKNKKYVLKSETDAFFEDEGYFSEIPVKDYDEGIKLQILYRDLKNNFLNTEEFSEYEFSYEGFNSPTAVFFEKYHFIKKNKKWGVLSTLGKYILEPKYDYIETMDNEYLWDKGNYLTIKAYIGKTCYAYDMTGKLMFQNENLKSESYPNASDLGGNYQFFGHEIKNGKKRGLIHQSGELIIPPIYDEYDYFDFTNKELIFTPTNFSETAKACEYYPFQQYYIGINRKTKERDFYAPNGQFLNKFKIDYIYEYNKFGYFNYEVDGKNGLIGNGACEIRKPAENVYIEVFQGNKNIFIVQEEEQSYFIDGKNKKMFSESFNTVTFSDTTYAIASWKDNYGLIDVMRSDKEIVWKIKADFENLLVLSFGNVSNYIFTKNGKTGVIDVNSKVLVPADYSKIFAKDSYLYTIKDNKYGLRNYQFETLCDNLYDTLFYLQSYQFLVKKDNKWAFYDVHDKKLMTNFDFDEIQLKDSYYNFYILKKNGKWGVLGDKYDWFIEPKYLEIKYDYNSKEYECLKENGQKDCFFVK